MSDSPRSRMTMRLLTILAVACTMFATASAQYGYINVYSPDKGAAYEAPSSVYIYWELDYVKDAYNNNSYLNLDYTPNGGKSWYSIASGLDIFTQEWNWDVTADLAPGDEYYIRVTEYCNGKRCTPVHYEGWSNPFSIIKSCSPPTIFKQPAPQIACSGTNVTFSVTSDVASATYTWTKNAVVIATTASNSYTIFNVGTSHEGTYGVTINAACGEKTTSASASLNVIASPKVTLNPVPLVEVCDNGSATLYVAGTGAGIAYQWRFNGVNIPFATGTSLFLDPLTASKAGNYDCVVSGTCTPSVTSTATKVVVIGKPIVTTELKGTVLCTGGSGSISIGVSGSSLSYQWYRNGVLVPSDGSSTLTFNNASQANAGTYNVVVVSGGANPLGCPSTFMSGDVFVSVVQAPSILNTPKMVEACIGQSAELVVQAEGFALTYQWYKNGVAIPNSNQHAYVINNVNSATTGNYTVTVTGSCGMTVGSAPIEVRAVREPAISQQPVSTTVQVGERITLGVTATDVTSMQWYKNSVRLEGATSASYVVESAKISDAGIYTVIIENSCNAIVSSQARVLVRDPANLMPELTLAPTAVDFGDVPVGYSKVMTLTNLLTNTGNAPLIVQSIVSTTPDFTITNAPSTPFTLQPNESATLSVRASAATTNTQTGALSVTSNAAISVEEVALTANGVRHLSHIDGMDFALVPMNTPKELCVSVTNSSSATVTIDQLTLLGLDAAMFSVVTATPLDVPAGESRELCVQFLPTTQGTRTAQLSILSSTAGNSSVALAGAGDGPSDVADDVASIMSIQPNPTNGAVSLRLTEFPATRIDIVSVTGVTVRSLAISASGIIAWDGLDAGGSPAASGAYLVVVHGVNRVISMPLSIIR